ncbi:sensor histidine kinase [Saccharomonospora sp. NB11]|uniref:sensor histidine kinase n=1 Tax=Saccharomonospora sp. NB11 TaxID=1642298 RepID=UPI0018D0BF8B|nr:histidine kinase [Saccharomonospora sp. NB11]
MSSTTERIARGAPRVGAGLLFGALAVVVELPFVLLTAPAVLVPPARRSVHRVARALAELHRTRLARFLNTALSGDYPDHRAWPYLAARCVVGGLTAGIVVLAALGGVGGGIMVGQLLSGSPVGGGTERSWYDPFTVVLGGALLVFLVVSGLWGVVVLERAVARRLLAPSATDRLRERVHELATTRAEVVKAVNAERRRIERDLHDGVQQSLVALGMVLGRARRTTSPDRVAELLRQAHEQSQDALRALREVAWRVYPVALETGGLGVALEALAERSTVPISLHYALADRVDEATEVVAYFVVSEAVTNALKHSGCTRVEIDVHRDDRIVVVRVVDDGVGGADVAGEGLTGLGRRVAAADGTLTVASPPGGPTVVRAELPCA